GESGGQFGLMTADAFAATPTTPASAALRLLRDDEYHTVGYTGAAPSDNVRLTIPDSTLPNSRTINSLTLTQFPVNVGNGATLTLASGVLVGLLGNAGIHGVGTTIFGNMSVGTATELLVYTPGVATDVTDFNISVFSGSTKTFS